MIATENRPQSDLPLDYENEVVYNDYENEVARRDVNIVVMG